MGVACQPPTPPHTHTRIYFPHGAKPTVRACVLCASSPSSHQMKSPPLMCAYCSCAVRQRQRRFLKRKKTSSRGLREAPNAASRSWSARSSVRPRVCVCAPSACPGPCGMQLSHNVGCPNQRAPQDCSPRCAPPQRSTALVCSATVGATAALGPAGAQLNSNTAPCSRALCQHGRAF